MFTVEQGTATSTLDEIVQNGYDLIGTTILLTSILQQKDKLIQQYSRYQYNLLLDNLIQVLEQYTSDINALVPFVRRQLKSVGDTL